MNTKNKTIISIVLFVLIFGALITLATFYDYQVSSILTKNALPEGSYLANDFFGVLFEAIGTSPIFIVISLCVGIIFWWCLKVVKKEPLNKILAIIVGIAGVVAWWFFVKDIFNYLFEHAANEAIVGAAEVYEYRHNTSVRVAEVFIALFLDAFMLLALKGISEDNLKKLFWFVVACACVCIVANVLIELIKVPIGRMRFRSINSDEGQALINSGLLDGRCDDGIAGYTRWYHINKQPSDDVINQMVAYYPGAKDAFKSFPSGHTCAAGMSYCLIMLPDVIEFKKKKQAKVLSWIVPIFITMIVAISRIVCGAHYFSDVTFGGTIAFLSVILFREIIILKGEHFFALFPKLKKNNKE